MSWEDPPRRAATDWEAVGRELMTRPGHFKIVATYSTANSAAVSAYQIRSGHEKKKALNALGKFHAEARNVDGEYRVYARYVGGAGSEATPNDLPGSTSPEPGLPPKPPMIHSDPGTNRYLWRCWCGETWAESPDSPPEDALLEAESTALRHWRTHPGLRALAAEPTKGGTE